LKIAKYLFVGATAAACDLFLFLILFKFYDLNWFYSSLFSFIFATILNYQLSILFVFKSGVRFRKKLELLIIFGISGVAVLINQLLLYILISNTNINIVISKILTTSFVFLWNYSARSNFVFIKKD
jgi:putative flippase GtrA